MTPGLIVVLACGAIALSLMAWQRWKAISHRRKIPLRQLHTDGRLEEVIDFDDFTVTMQLIGRAYGFQPGKLRVTDSFSGELALADAVLPDDGRETLWRALKEKYPSLSEHNRLETIADLISEVGKTVNRTTKKTG